MSQTKRNFGDFQSCQVCFEDFEENGDHLPRILPCHHTLCHKCVGQLIRNNRLECPECRRIFAATNREKAFPQNMYILAHIHATVKLLQTERVRQASVFEKCAEHGKELNLFCKEEECKRPICVSCMKHHNKHGVVDIEEETKLQLYQNINVTEETLEAIVRNAQTVRQQIEIKTENFTSEVKKRRKEITEKFDKMIKDAECNLMEVYTTIDKDISKMKENLRLVRWLKGKSGDDDSHKVNLKSLDILKGVEDNIKRKLSCNMKCRYQESIRGQALEDILYGNIVQKEISVDLSQLCEAQPEDVRSKSVETVPQERTITTVGAPASRKKNKKKNRKKNRTITHASQPNYQGN